MNTSINSPRGEPDHFSLRLAKLSLPLRNEYVGVRHARALSNELNILITTAADGHDGYGLVELGREQARMNGVRLVERYSQARLKDALVVSSPFLRARETAQIMGEVAGVSWPHRIDARLSERFFGEFDKGTVLAVTERSKADRLDANNSEGGVESPTAVATRIADLLAELDGTHSGRVILLFSHADPLRIFHRAIRSDRKVQDYADMEDWPNAEFKEFCVER
jgi:broad specificity phosphatase PhoE